MQIHNLFENKPMKQRGVKVIILHVSLVFSPISGAIFFFFLNVLQKLRMLIEFLYMLHTIINLSIGMDRPLQIV